MIPFKSVRKLILGPFRSVFFQIYDWKKSAVFMQLMRIILHQYLHNWDVELHNYHYYHWWSCSSYSWVQHMYIWTYLDSTRYPKKNVHMGTTCGLSPATVPKKIKSFLFQLSDLSKCHSLTLWVMGGGLIAPSPDNMGSCAIGNDFFHNFFWWQFLFIYIFYYSFPSKAKSRLKKILQMQFWTRGHFWKSKTEQNLCLWSYRIM